MCEVISIRAREMMPIINEILASGNSAKITVTGMSMYPFLREGIDQVELKKYDYTKVRPGQIVIIRRDSGEYVMHRVLKEENNYFYIIGDGQQWIEGPIRYEQIFAIITSVWRENKHIDCSNLWWRFFSSIWLRVIPFRCLIIYYYRRLRRVVYR